MKFRRAFTLLELLIVFFIIGILATLALPNLVESRRNANEVRVIKYMANLSVAQEMFRSRFSLYAGASTYQGQQTNASIESGDEDLINAGVLTAPISGLASNDEIIFGYHFFVQAGGERAPTSTTKLDKGYTYTLYENKKPGLPGQAPVDSFWFAWCHSVSRTIGKRIFYTDFRGSILFAPDNYDGLGEYVGPLDQQVGN